ncbi:MAG: hypothetical protein RBU21_17725, partial [FCB group bacterium]|nr:hypothetical protein [FCB group bacterium]
MPTTLPQLSFVEALRKEVLKGETRAFEAIGPWGSGKTLAALQLAEALGVPALFVTQGRIDADAVFDDLTSFAGEDRVVLLPAWEVLPTDLMNPADDTVAERMNALKELASARETGRAKHAVLPVRSLMQCVVNRERLERDTLTLRVGQEHDLEDLTLKLVALGYEREMMVEQRGQMSVRGGIFDIFPIAGELLYRIEFFGDEIESIRRFEPETQRSIDRVDSL